MNTNLRLSFPGTCDEAFTFYENIFGTKRVMTMRYGDAPPEMKIPDAMKPLVMHTSMQLGTILVMASDEAPEKAGPMGGFAISLDMPDEAEVRRLYAALGEGGTVVMALGPTFWTPLFGMLTDKFGVGWMVAVPGPAMPSQ